MLASTKYQHVTSKASNIRKKYGYATQECIRNMKDVSWVARNLSKLSPPDIALLAEYTRDPTLRQQVVQYLDAIL